MENYIKLDNCTILKIGDSQKKHILLNSKFSLDYMGYLMIIEDLKSVLKALNKLKETDTSEKIIRESLTFYIAITYGKAFAKADVRKIKLDRKQLKKLRDDQIALHDVLIDIRNKHIAHAGSNIFSLINLIAQINDNSVKIFLSGLNLSSFNHNITAIEELIHEILKICDNKSEKAYQMLINELKSQNKEDVMKDAFLPSNYQIYSFNEIQNEINKLNTEYYNK